MSRCVFTIINSEHFSGLTLVDFLQLSFYGIRYDLSAILIINLIYIFLLLLPLPFLQKPLAQKLLQWWFIISNTLAFSFEISDWAYFNFTLKRATVDVIYLITRKGDFWNLLPHFLVDSWYAPLGFAGLIFLLYVLNRKIIAHSLFETPPAVKAKTIIVVQQIGLLILLIGLCLIGIRGGLQYIPIGNSNALMVTTNERAPIVLNTPFSILHSLEARQEKPLHYYTEKELINYINPIKLFNDKPFVKKNIVFIIVESLSKNFTALGSRKSFTPFLDSLMQYSLLFDNAYANALHSAEGIPAVISGLPSLMEEPITTSFYSTNRLTSIPDLLRKEGYKTAFYHGGTNGTMSFDVYAANAGYEKYFGRKEYNNDKDYDGHWGIWDEPFLQYFAQGLNALQQPFMASVFTLSSHDPFNVPQQYASILPKGDKPWYQAVAYTDLALREFFATASQQPWYNNTIFIITPDHASPIISVNNPTVMGMYEIPVVFYAPADSTLRGRNHSLFQQIDILPTILHYLGYPKKFFALGNDLYNSERPRFVINELSGSYKWLMNGTLLLSNDMTPMKLYNYTTDSTGTHNLLHNKPNDETINYFKAFMQTYRDALIHNRLYVADTTAKP